MSAAAPSSDLPTPLSGLLGGARIIDLSRNLPGPFATRMLADLGAEIIKIEPPEGDPARALGTLFASLNHGKESRRIDFKSEADRTTLREWIRTADVVIDSFRPGVLAALGLDFASLVVQQPRLVMCSITGYGQSGPWAQRAGHDLNFMAMSGALDQMRLPGGELPMPNVQWGDLAGGSALACIAVLSGVLHAQRTGRGVHLDTSMAHGLHSLLVMPQATGPMMAALLGRHPGPGEDMLSGVLPCYRLYRTADARHLAVGALEHKFWALACQGFEHPDWAAQHWQRGLLPGSAGSAALIDAVAQLVASQPLAVWRERFEPLDACVTPVLTLDEAAAHALFTRRLPSAWSMMSGLEG